VRFDLLFRVCVACFFLVLCSLLLASFGSSVLGLRLSVLRSAGPIHSNRPAAATGLSNPICFFLLAVVPWHPIYPTHVASSSSLPFLAFSVQRLYLPTLTRQPENTLSSRIKPSCRQLFPS
jgi:hypothetical protein